MVHQQFVLHYGSKDFTFDYDTTDGFDALQVQIFSLTSVAPDRQKIVVHEGGLVLREAGIFVAVPDRLLLEEGEEGSMTSTDELLARILQVEEDKKAMMQIITDDGGKEFEQRICPRVKQVLMYENQIRQEAARSTVPVEEIKEKALIWLAEEGTSNPSKDVYDHAFLLQLLFWFKRTFSWVDAPSCDGCFGGDTVFTEMADPKLFEGCFQVELYRCSKCSRTTWFPRYNDPMKLLETKCGRNEEWVNCFTLCCRAFGYECRLIVDFTDRVWTECFSNMLGRWMHLDPCEGIYDEPLLYEKGWNKNLSYVIAISKDGTYDVTRRYTRKWYEVLSRRNITIESSAKDVLSKLTKRRRSQYSQETLSVLKNRDKEEENELENIDHQTDLLLELLGMQSDSQEQRFSTLTVDAGDVKATSDTSCLSRTCDDDHVSEIYNSLSNLLRHFVRNGLSKTEVVVILQILNQSLVDLKSSSFEVRKSFIDPHSNGSQPFQRSLPVIDEFLSAVSLRREVDVDEKISISLATDPERTSIALPVALGCLKEIIVGVDKINQFDESFLINFSRFNRISYGSVLASGEEIPFGIATSAFDGCHSSKWVEPNGANGCWLVYKVKHGQAHTLRAYELMSSNDNPESDPKSWILEGSENGGFNWNSIDEQTCQIFDERSQRKRFKVESKLMLNVLRFKFLSVRNPEATSRFQIGNIDLYAAKS